MWLSGIAFAFKRGRELNGSRSELEREGMGVSCWERKCVCMCVRGGRSSSGGGCFGSIIAITISLADRRLLLSGSLQSNLYLFSNYISDYLQEGNSIF